MIKKTKRYARKQFVNLYFPKLSVRISKKNLAHFTYQNNTSKLKFAVTLESPCNLSKELRPKALRFQIAGHVIRFLDEYYQFFDRISSLDNALTLSLITMAQLLAFEKRDLGQRKYSILTRPHCFFLFDNASTSLLADVLLNYIFFINSCFNKSTLILLAEYLL